MTDLDELRARRWWKTRTHIGSIQRAAAFIDDVGFALLFPKSGSPLPSLWEACSDRPLSSLPQEWGPDIQRVWGWKDELPRKRLAWYGRFLRGRPSFLSPKMLADLYPREGKPDDFLDAKLGDDARRIARIVLSSGPTASSVLREASRLEGKAGGQRFSAALTELGRALVLTNFGTEGEGSGWPSAVLELTARAFRVKQGDRIGAARRFLDTVVAAKPGELGTAFGWSAADARTVLETLDERGEARVRAGTYTLVRPARPTRGARA